MKKVEQNWGGRFERESDFQVNEIRIRLLKRHLTTLTCKTDRALILKVIKRLRRRK